MPTADLERITPEAVSPKDGGYWPDAGRSAVPAIFPRWLFDRRGNASRPKICFSVAFLDAVLVMAAGVAASVVTAGRDGWAMNSVWLAAALAIVFAAVMQSGWSYSIAALHKPVQQVEKVVRAGITVFGTVTGLAYLAGLELFPPALGLTWLVLAMTLTALSRFPVARLLDRLRDGGNLVRRTIIVGGGAEAEKVIRALEQDGTNSVQILGVFDDRSDDRSADSFCGYPNLGNFDQLAGFARNSGADLLIVTVPTAAEERLLQILQRLMPIPVDIRISALSSKLKLNDRVYTYIGGVPMLDVMSRPLTDWDRAIKNVEDRVLGALLLLAAAPVMALTAIAIRLDGKGPILFKQRRYGFNNELIEVYKFRSMRVEAADATASRLVTRDDPRVTRVGRFIRKSSLDELPQLFNVLKGEMSLVGPRPHATEAKAQSDLYQTVVGSYFSRHRVKPGVTGWAQIKGWRGETDTHEKLLRRVEHDLAYIDGWSLGFDLYILAMTPFSLLTGKNAY